MFAAFFVALCFLFGFSKGDCTEGCKEPTLFYDSLQCLPIFENDDGCCPKEYNCSHLQSRNNTGYCYFKRKAYRVGEMVNDYDVYGNCLLECTCIEKYPEEKMFKCAKIECPEWLGLKPEEGCQFRYQLNKCCSTGETCPPFNVKCKVGDKIYKEGEKFSSPEKKCTDCVCGRGFRGRYEGPFCKRKECLEEVTNQLYVRHFCAPSYTALEDCCPSQWICPDNDVVLPTSRVPERDEPKCKFGDRTLNIGDRFERLHPTNTGKVTCECRIPPFLTCYQDKLLRFPVFIDNY